MGARSRRASQSVELASERGAAPFASTQQRGFWATLGVMTAVERLVAEVVDQADWEALPVESAAWEPLPQELPEDLVAFARVCGGIRTPKGLVIAQHLRHAQQAILGEKHPEDRSSHWYVIAEDDMSGTAERAVIDLHPARQGRCYDAFWDSFAVAGSMGVAATSFTDFLTRVIDAGGAAYWSGQALGMGDAYD
jgi:antitoxin YokJ